MNLSLFVPHKTIINPDWNQVFKFVIIFIFLTIIGTQSHELAHYIVAKILGFNPTLHFDRVSYGVNQEYNKIFLKKELIICIAGPLQTIMTGSIGLSILCFRKFLSKQPFTVIDWIAAFFSFFWLRQCFNLFLSITKGIVNKKNVFGGDEGKISRMLGLYSGSIGIVLGLIGMIICCYVVFILIPIEKRLNLLLGAICGSLLGFVVWFNLIGKIILP